MQSGWAGVLAVAMAAVGCGPDSGPTGTQQSCAALGWSCGVDDSGRSCGTCSAGTSCNGLGRCVGGGASCTCGSAVCGLDTCGRAVCGSCVGSYVCAAGSCVPPQTTPTTHDVGSARLPLFSGVRGVTFSVPAARVAYSVSSPTDTFDVGIYTMDEWTNYAAGGSARAYAARQNVRIASEVAMLPAGNYVLGFACRNLIERCDVTYALNANY